MRALEKISLGSLVFVANQIINASVIVAQVFPRWFLVEFRPELFIVGERFLSYDPEGHVTGYRASRVPDEAENGAFYRVVGV